jgi:hypothetical protein
MSLSIDDLGRIAPWLRTQGDRALEVLFRTKEFFGDEGQFRQLTLYDALGFAFFLTLIKIVVDIPIDVAVLKIDPLSPTVQAVSIILLMISATALGIAIFIAARLMRLATDLVTSMKAGYYLWAFDILIETLTFPLRASSREQLIVLETFSFDVDQAGDFISSLSMSFWFFILLVIGLTIWRLMRWTLAVRVIYAVATWRALVVVLLAEAITAYIQGVVLNPLSRQAINTSLGAT